MRTNYIIAVFLAAMCAFTLTAFVFFGFDKWKAVRRRWRISESALILLSVFGGVGGLLGMLVFRHKTRKWKFRILVPFFAVLDVIAAVFLIWSAHYYRADEAALAAMQPDHSVSVEKTGTGWFFDGPSEEDALIFYPGAKVEERAYAPLLHKIAEEGVDVYLIRMPLNLAFFGVNKAEKAVREGKHSHYYLGGHSLGGAMAAVFAAEHEDAFDGLILLAAYPTKETGLDTLIIYGSEDRVLNMDRIERAAGYVTGNYEEHVISGGNHAQFGNYGEQVGDGDAAVTGTEQQDETVSAILSAIQFMGKH